MKNSAIHITLYDLSGAPLHPQAQVDFVKAAEELAKKNKLVYSIART